MHQWLKTEEGIEFRRRQNANFELFKANCDAAQLAMKRYLARQPSPCRETECVCGSGECTGDCRAVSGRITMCVRTTMNVLSTDSYI